VIFDFWGYEFCPLPGRDFFQAVYILWYYFIFSLDLDKICGMVLLLIYISLRCFGDKVWYFGSEEYYTMRDRREGMNRDTKITSIRLKKNMHHAVKVYCEARNMAITEFMDIALVNELIRRSCLYDPELVCFDMGGDPFSFWGGFRKMIEADRDLRIQAKFFQKEVWSFFPALDSDGKPVPVDPEKIGDGKVGAEVVGREETVQPKGSGGIVDVKVIKGGDGSNVKKSPETPEKGGSEVVSLVVDEKLVDSVEDVENAKEID